MSGLRGVLFLLLIGSVAACESKPADEPAAPTADGTTTATAGGGETAGTAVEAPAADKSDEYAAMADDAWCPAAHEDTVKIVTAMKATMKKAGVADGEDEYAPPARERYVELCGKLPLPMQKCLVVGYSARNRDACQAALDALDTDAKAAYAELMGK